MQAQAKVTVESILSLDLGTDRAFVAKRVTDASVAMLNQWAGNGIARDTFNQKAVKRIVELTAFASNPTSEAIAASTGLRASVALCLVAALAKPGQTIRFADMKHALHAGTGGEDAKNIAGVSRAKLSRFIGTVEAGAVSSMVSRTMGKKGFLTALGLVGRADKSAVTFAENVTEAQIVRDVAKAVSSMTEGQLNAI